MAAEIPTVDLACFGDGTPEARQEAARKLRDACTRLGCVNLTSIGMPEKRLQEAFGWSKKLFDLSMEDKMKAPHPPTPMPHRGYSDSRLEKLYSKAERDQDEQEGSTLGKVEEYVKVRTGCRSVRPRLNRTGKLRGRQRGERRAAQRLAPRGHAARVS